MYLESILGQGALFFIFAMGAIVGSFLNVYIYRLHTGKSLNGRSHCMSCGVQLRWFELFPLFSYLVLRGKCRSCGCRITPRYFLIELVTALLFTVAAVVSVGAGDFMWLTSLLLILLVITVYDYYHFIIPDEFTAAATFLVVGWLGYAWWQELFTTETLFWTVGASVVGVCFFLILWLVSGGKWLGFGDVKLAFPLGLWVGPSLVFSFVVMSFWIGAFISLVILGYQKYERGKRSLHLSTKTLTMKSAVPFAPFLIISATIVHLLSFDVLNLFNF